MSEQRDGLPKRMWKSLISPVKAFESIEEKDLRTGLIVITVICILSAWARYNYSFKTPIPQLPNSGLNGGLINQDTFRTNFAILLSLANGLGVVVDWLVLSVLIYLAGRLIAGKGSLKRMFVLTAFSSTPLIIQQALRLIDSYIVSEEVLLNVISARSSVQNFFISQALSVLTVFGIWSLALASIAVSVNHKTSQKRALASTLAAYVIFILLQGAPFI